MWVNPARAGMIPIHPSAFVVCTGKPRASGDDPDFVLPAGLSAA